MPQSPDERRRRARRYYEENRERIRGYQRSYVARKRADDPGYGRRLRWKLKLEIIAAYGGCCACCGETNPEFLCVDHIEGGGNSDRRENRWSGRQFYAQLKRDGFPKGKLRLLCANCNSSFGLYGYCPHADSGRRCHHHRSPIARANEDAAKA